MKLPEETRYESRYLPGLTVWGVIKMWVDYPCMVRECG